MIQQQERRKHRSEDPSEAIRFQLQHVADNHDLEVLVLADRAGNLWSAASIDDEAEKLAASLADLQLTPDQRGLGRTRHGHRPVNVAQVEVGTTTLMLGAQSRWDLLRGRRTENGLQQARNGISRILGELAE